MLDHFNNQHKTNPTGFHPGVDHVVFDQRDFNLTLEDLKKLCRFFSLGNLKHYVKEKGTVISHSNFFIFVETYKGQFAFKFYPPSVTKSIIAEYTVNRLLITRKFPAPKMYPGTNEKPFMPINNYLATCLEYIDGVQIWHKIRQKETIIAMNTAMLHLKTILTSIKKPIPLQKKERLIETVKTLIQESQALSKNEQKKLIGNVLNLACQTYLSDTKLFSRQLIHNNASLTNFLIKDNTVFTLDLGHIKEDYILSDLASFVISCYLCKIPKRISKTVISDYFIQHKLKKEYKKVLCAILQVSLIQEYLKNIQREKSLKIAPYPQRLTKTFRSRLQARIGLIEKMLTKEKLI